MKQLITFIVLVSLATASFAQQVAPKPPLTQADYLEKSKTQKKTGTVLLAVGAGVAISSFIIPKGELLTDCNSSGFPNEFPCDDSYQNDGLKNGLAIAGSALVLTGVFFHTWGSKNKRKAEAASAFMKIEKTPVLQQTAIRNHSFPAFGVRVSF